MYEGGGDERVDNAARRFRRPKNHTAAPAIAKTAAPPIAMPAIAPPDSAGEGGGETLAAGGVVEEIVEVAEEVVEAVKDLEAEDVDDVGKATSSRLVTLRVSLPVAKGCNADSDVKVSFNKAPLTFAIGFDAVDQQILA